MAEPMLPLRGPALRTLAGTLLLLGLAGALLFWGRTPPPPPAVYTDPVPSTPGWKPIGHRGPELGGFNQPRGIVGLPDGGFFVADRSARMQRFDAQGKAVDLWTLKEHAAGNPKGLTLLPDGNLLVCDTHYGRVLIMSLKGDILATWGGPGKEPGQFAHPLACAVDPIARVAYIVEYGWYNDRVQKFDLAGRFLAAWGSDGREPGQFHRPSGIALDSAGLVYVADAGNHRIQKFDANGRLLKVFGSLGTEPGTLRYPYDIACSPDGLLYVAEFNNHRISVFDREGTFLEVLGSPGTGEGQFFSPWSLTVDARGRLLVSDTGNCRIQIRQVSKPQADLGRLARASAPHD